MKQPGFRAQFNDRYMAMYPGASMPLNVTFIVTNDCNLRCTYCYQHAKNKRRMTVETGRRIVDFLYECDEKNDPYINKDNADGLILDFIGGEPLLEIDTINGIMDYFLDEAMRRNHRWQLRYMLSISTNGTLMDDERVKRFLMKHKGRISVGVTVDGDKQLHDACRLFPDGSGSYDAAFNAALFVKDKLGQDNTKLTIAPGNLEHLARAAIHMFTEQGVSYLHANPVYEEGWTQDHAQEYYRQLKGIADWLLEDNHWQRHGTALFDDFIGKPMPEYENQNWCGGDMRMRCFDTDGTIYPCLRFAPLSLGGNAELYTVGHIDTGFAVTPEQAHRISCLSCVTRRSQSTDECFNCPIASGCAWCTAYNYEVFGTPDKRATFICGMHKARVLANVYYWNRLRRLDDTVASYPCHVPDDWALGIADAGELLMLKGLAEN